MAIIPFLERLVWLTLRARGVQSRYVATPRGNLHLYDAPGRGDLPTIVCLHGLGSSAAAWGSLLTRLRGHARRVLMPEMPGHGLSGPASDPCTVDDVSDVWTTLLLQELDEPAVVVANSLGGAMALRFALEHPDKVLAIILSSPAGAHLEPPVYGELIENLQLTSRDDGMKFLGRLYHRLPWFGRFLAPDLVRMFNKQGMLRLVASFERENHFTPEELARLTMPILLLWGRSDRLMPRQSLDYYRQHLPAHTVIEELSETGHSPHVEFPAETAARILEVARSVAASAALRRQP